jgi:hypothetical protein
MHHTGPRRMPLAAPMAFNDLGPLILRDHPLDLQEHVIFWTLASSSVEKNDLDPGAPELIDQQHLIRVFAGQAIWGVDIETVHGPRRNHIAQPLQGWPDQCRPTVPLINARHRAWYCQAFGSHALTQRGHLTRDGVGLGLLVRRDPCINRSLG